jgi:predicted amidohydrolase
MPASLSRRLLALAVLAAVGGLAARSAAGAPGELRVAAVQLRIAPADLASRQAYERRIAGLVERCLPFRPDLILFPEYASAFLAILPYGGALQGAASLEQALGRALAREPLARSLGELFLLNSGLAGRAARELYGGLARRHGLAIGAGSWFAADCREGRTVLVNRAVVFDERGGELYCQDKVFLTPFEEQVLSLAPGSLGAARPFLVRGRRLALTLCRDTFFADWERVLGEAELWLDLKANGRPFGAQEQVDADRERALPARLRGSGVPYGLTLCLTGSLPGLAWEGRSAAVQRLPGGERLLARAASPTGEEILFFCLP